MIDLVNRIYLHQCSAYCYKETHRRGEAHTHRREWNGDFQPR